jgi:hypothetical protein
MPEIIGSGDQASQTEFSSRASPLMMALVGITLPLIIRSGLQVSHRRLQVFVEHMWGMGVANGRRTVLSRVCSLLHRTARMTPGLASAKKEVT